MKRLKFSIRFLLVLAALVAVAITIHRQRKPIHVAIHTLEARGAKIEYHPSSIPWFHALTKRYFANPVMIDMGRCRANNEDAESIAALPSIERLYLKHAQMNFRGVEHISTLPKLKRLALWGNSQIFDNSAELLSRCETLEVIDVHDTRINGSGLAAFAKLPRLKKLIFPARFTSAEKDWVGSDSIRILSDSAAELVPVGKCFLYGVDDDAMHRFLDMDTSRVTRLQIRDGAFSDAVWKRLKQLKLGELDLQRCPVSDDQLAMLDATRIGTLELYFPDGWDKPEVTAQGLSRFLGDRVDEIRIYDSYAQFFDSKFSSNWHRIRITPQQDLFDNESLTHWIDAGAKSITIFREDSPRLMEHLAALNPTIRLTLIDESQHWEQIEQMTNLDWLTLHTRGNLERPMRFTDAHKLKHLEVTGPIAFNRDDLRSIAQLKQLDWLELQSRQPLTSELDELSGLSKLRKVIVK